MNRLVRPLRRPLVFTPTLLRKSSVQQFRPTTHLSESRPPRRHKSTGDSFAKYLMLGIPVATFCLGTWQVRRRTWKNNIIEEINRKTDAEPIPLPEDVDSVDWKSLEYTPVKVRGAFDHSKELYVMPRVFIQRNTDAGSSLISIGPRTGLHVITPFFIPERGYSILVNRGFVDKDRKDPKTRLDGQIEGEIEISGLIRTSSDDTYMPSKDLSRNEWPYVDVEEMSRVRETKPVIIDADNKATVKNGPIGGQTRIQIRNQHMSYILTWYSLSAITSILWYHRYIR